MKKKAFAFQWVGLLVGGHAGSNRVAMGKRRANSARH